MKKVLLGAVSIVALSVAGSASAADLKTPVYKAPPPVVAPVLWTGFYIGAHVGGGWGAKDWDQTTFEEEEFVDFPANFPVNGFLGGGQFGYRYQSGMWVFGAEGSISGADITGRDTCGIDGFFTCQTSANWIATITGQVGWAVDHALLYLKGGVAAIHDKNTLGFAFGEEENFDCGIDGVVCSFTGSSQTRWGPLFGAGITYAFDPHWQGFIEYNYMDFGSKSFSFVESYESEHEVVGTWNIDQRIHVIKAGVNYRFDWWGGGTAPY